MAEIEVTLFPTPIANGGCGWIVQIDSDIKGRGIARDIEAARDRAHEIVFCWKQQHDLQQFNPPFAREKILSTFNESTKKESERV